MLSFFVLFFKKVAGLQVTLLSFIHRHAKHYRVGRSYAVTGTSGSGASGDPAAVRAVMRVVTVRIQAALMSRPALSRSGGRRLIPGRDHHAAPCMVHFCSANAIFIVGFSSLSRG